MGAGGVGTVGADVIDSLRLAAWLAAWPVVTFWGAGLGSGQPAWGSDASWGSVERKPGSVVFESGLTT